MARIKRLERIVALTKELNDHPFQLFPFSYFCEKFAVAKSTLSEAVHLRSGNHRNRGGSQRGGPVHSLSFS